MQKRSILELCQIAIFAAVIAILSQLVIPMPLGVSMTMQTFAVSFTGIVLGRRRGCIAALMYVLLGAVGLPVFQSFTGGAGIIAGPTGGFILSFPIMAWLAGLGADRGGRVSLALGLAAGTFVSLSMGTAVYMAVTGSGFVASLTACVLPFIAVEIIKCVMAGYLGPKIRRAIGRSLAGTQ